MLSSIPEEFNSIRENSRDLSESSLKQQRHSSHHRRHRDRGSLRVDQSRQDSWLDRARQGVHCSLFCGGRRCKYERWSALTQEQQKRCAIQGLNSNWVGEDIIASQRPSSSLFLKYFIIQQFKAKKVSVVVNLQEKGEHGSCGPDGVLATTGYSYSGKDDLMAKGISYYEFPWPDMTAPEQDVVLRSIQVMDHHARQKGKVLVHCHAGLGRTGLLIACYYVYCYHMSSWDAIQLVRGSRPGAIQTSRQFEFICDFEKHLWRLSQAFCIELSDARVDVDVFVGRQRHILHGSESDLHRFTPRFLHKILCRLINLVRFDRNKGESALKSFGISARPDSRILQQCRLGINRLQFNVKEINNETLLAFLVGDWFRCMSTPALSMETCQAIIQFQRCRSPSTPPKSTVVRRSSGSPFSCSPLIAINTASTANESSICDSSRDTKERDPVPPSHTIPYSEDSPNSTSSGTLGLLAHLSCDTSDRERTVGRGSTERMTSIESNTKTGILFSSDDLPNKRESNTSPFYLPFSSSFLTNGDYNSTVSHTVCEKDCKSGLGETGIMREQQRMSKRSSPNREEQGHLAEISARGTSLLGTTSTEKFNTTVSMEGNDIPSSILSSEKMNDPEGNSTSNERHSTVFLPTLPTCPYGTNPSQENVAKPFQVPNYPKPGVEGGMDIYENEIQGGSSGVFPSSADHSLASGSAGDCVSRRRANSCVPLQGNDETGEMKGIIGAGEKLVKERQKTRGWNPFDVPVQHQAYQHANPLAEEKKEHSVNINHYDMKEQSSSATEIKEELLKGRNLNQVRENSGTESVSMPNPQKQTAACIHSATEFMAGLGPAGSSSSEGRGVKKNRNKKERKEAAHARRAKRSEKKDSKQLSASPPTLPLTGAERFRYRQASFLSSSSPKVRECSSYALRKSKKRFPSSITDTREGNKDIVKRRFTSTIHRENFSPAFTSSSCSPSGMPVIDSYSLPKGNTEGEKHEPKRRLSISLKLTLSPSESASGASRKKEQQENRKIKQRKITSSGSSAFDVRRSPGLSRGIQKCSGRMGVLYFLNTVTTPAVRHTLGMVLSAVECICAETIIYDRPQDTRLKGTPSLQEIVDEKLQSDDSKGASSGSSGGGTCSGHSNCALLRLDGTPGSPEEFQRNKVSPASPFFPFASRILSESEMQNAKRQAYRSLVDSFNHACHPLKRFFAVAERELLYDFFMECGSLIGDAYFNSQAPAAANAFSRTTHRVAVASKKTLESTKVTGPCPCSPALPSLAIGLSFSRIPIYTQCEADTPLNRSLFSARKPSRLKKFVVSLLRCKEVKPSCGRVREESPGGLETKSHGEKTKRSILSVPTHVSENMDKKLSLSSSSSHEESSSSGTSATFSSSAYGSLGNPLEHIPFATRKGVN